MGFERGAVSALLKHPVLLLEAIRSWAGMRRRGGLGLSPAYLRWRRATAYGDHTTTISAHDVVNYLKWRREMRTVRKWERVA